VVAVVVPRARISRDGPGPFSLRASGGNNVIFLANFGEAYY